MTKALDLEQAITAATQITAASLRGGSNHEGAYAAENFLLALKKICESQGVQIKQLWPEMTNKIAAELVSAVIEGTGQQGDVCGERYAAAVRVLSKG